MLNWIIGRMSTIGLDELKVKFNDMLDELKGPGE